MSEPRAVRGGMTACQFRVRTMIGGVIVAACSCAALRVWPFTCAAAFIGYAMLAVIAAFDLVVRLVFGPRPRRFPWPWRVAAAPLRLLHTSALAEEGGAIRAAALAIVTHAVVVGGETAWKFIGSDLAYELGDGWASPDLVWLRKMWDWNSGVLSHRSTWRGSWWFELRAVPFLWATFGGLAALVAASRRAGPRGELLRRLAFFSPWLVVLRLGPLWSHWLWYRFGSGTEPMSGPAVFFTRQIFLLWLNITPSVFAAGLAFLRGVGGWRWGPAIVGAIVFVFVYVMLAVPWFWYANPFMRLGPI